MLQARLDHIVITSPSLEAGIGWVRETLGVAPEPGGRHSRMGTHNALLRLGEDAYLEVLAIDPEAHAPARPRWFELDRLGPGDPPRLAAWVARTNDLHGAVVESPIDCGGVEAMTRGSFRWLIAVREDGTLPAHGVAPVLLHWETRVHPAEGLPERGCSLVALQGFHPEAEAIRSGLARLGFTGPFSVSDAKAPALLGHVRTPSGVRALGGEPEL